ncbi:MAG: transglycosylase domain-containing protein [Gemmatimonadetes bacterium]|nr:transglycosylase domain-containing protein [Gemmatimonadota bacterium]
MPARFAPCVLLVPCLLGAQQPATPKPSTGEAWQITPLAQSSQVYARDGSLIGEIGRQWRTSVPLSSLPRYLPQAVIAVEDRRFYQHDGVDLVGIAGAVKDNLMGDSRGASTITQQLVGNLHPDIVDRRERGLAGVPRKLREQRAAREMERRYTKEQILEAYLNAIHFGRNWFGVEAAARHYFGKSATRVTLAEAASLAALPKGPAIYDPARHPERNRNRRNAILDLMAAQGFITRPQAATAKATPVTTISNGGLPSSAPWFVDVVRTQLERAGVPVGQGGFKVVTTLDPQLQNAAWVALVEGTAAVESRAGYRNPTYAKHPKGSTDYLQGMVVAIEPTSGDVRALVGGRSYREAPFNRAVNGVRQPGSAFKPFVYARAILDSIPANAIVPDTSLELAFDRGQLYRPRNADGEFLGDLTLREALARSRNPVAVQLWQRVTGDSVIALARRMGIRSYIAPWPSSAIGASAVQPLDLVAAFTAFPNLGTPAEPRFIVRAEDAAGRVVFSQGVRTLPPAMTPEAAFIVRELMRDVVDRGTATVVRRYLPPTVPVAGKTGTTDDNTDVWFVGATTDLVAGVWLGFDRPRSIMAGAAGGTLAAPIFGQMLARSGYGRTGEWTAPPGLVTAELDRVTGKLAEAATPPERRYLEYFLPGTEPGALRVDARRLFGWGPIP